jgi:hypothetical protein
MDEAAAEAFRRQAGGAGAMLVLVKLGVGVLVGLATAWDRKRLF